MKRHLLTLITVVMCMFLFVICASAETYTVSSNDEYSNAYESAVNGDTIIVDAKLTCDIYANKSLTYVLKADWQSSKLVINQSNVEVSFIADGGNYKIMPTNYSTTDGWMNIAEIYENVVINLGGMNGGTLTIDGSNATHDRVSYVTASANVVLNLLNGSAIANFNNKTKDDNISACIIYAHTVNMYDGCKIYGNNVISAPLIKTTYFNMFGGEIFGNLLTSTRFQMRAVGAIYADKQFTMYGGNIYDNVIKATHDSNYNFNVAGFITTDYGYRNGKVVIYNGEIGNLYVFGNKGNNCTSLFGIAWRENPKSYFYYNTGIETGKQYQFTDEPAFAYDQDTGKTIWQVENTTVINENYYGYCWDHNRQAGNKVAIFLNAQKKNIAGKAFDTYTVINAYIDGIYAYSGSNTISIPSGYTLWSTDGNKYCHTGKAYTLDEVKASSSVVFYSAYVAEKETVGGITMCSGCKTRYTCNDPTHDLEILTISYTNYAENGKKIFSCNTCGLEKACEVDVDPIFTCLGYSIGPNGYSLKAGFMVNLDALKAYKEFYPSFTFGVVIVNANTVKSSEAFFVSEVINSSAKGIMVRVDDLQYTILNVDISNFNADMAGTLELVVGLYTNDGEGNMTVAQHVNAKSYTTTKSYSDMKLNAITFNQVRIAHDMEALVPTTPPTTTDEE